MAEMDKDKLLIRLHVYDTEMAVNIPREDEALYRNSAIRSILTLPIIKVGKATRSCCIWL